jgi:hypothetical protein
MGPRPALKDSQTILAFQGDPLGQSQLLEIAKQRVFHSPPRLRVIDLHATSETARLTPPYARQVSTQVFFQHSPLFNVHEKAGDFYSPLRGLSKGLTTH